MTRLLALVRKSTGTIVNTLVIDHEVRRLFGDQDFNYQDFYDWSRPVMVCLVMGQSLEDQLQASLERPEPLEHDTPHDEERWYRCFGRCRKIIRYLSEHYYPIFWTAGTPNSWGGLCKPRLRDWRYVPWFR